MKNGYQLVTFLVGEENFGINIENVQEIVKVPEITRIPRSPSYVKGITNLRGEIFPVIDTHVRFNFQPKVISKGSRLIVVNFAGRITGLIVDRINEVVRLGKDQIEPPPHLIKGITEEYLKGVVNLVSPDEENEYLLMVLNLDSFCKINIVEEERYSFLKETSEQTSEKVEEIELVSFTLSDEEYAINISGVKEIIRPADMVKIPNSPDYVKGLISHRERLLPVIDLKIKFKSKTTEPNDSSRIIIIDIQNILIGLFVDSVKGIIKIPKFIIEPPPNMIAETESDELFGIAKLNAGRRLVMLIDLEKIFSYDDLKKLEESSAENKNNVSVNGERSAALAQNNLDDEENLIVFRLNKEEFCIYISQVMEINRIQTITKLPNAPDFVHGVLNLRGKIIPVISLRKRFNMENVQESEEYLYNARIIVVNTSGKESGLMVDGVSEVVRIDKRSVEPIPEVVKSSISTEYMAGIVRIQAKNRILILMDLEKILTEAEAKELIDFSERELSTIQEDSRNEISFKTERRVEKDTKNDKIKDLQETIEGNDNTVPDNEKSNKIIIESFDNGNPPEEPKVKNKPGGRKTLKRAR
jgi:purine-binding chemotaxis protein CheW